MRAILGITFGFLLVGVATPSPSQTPTHFWSQRFGGTGTDTGFSVDVDGSGNTVVTGQFQGTVNFGGGNLMSAGGVDIFLAKYSASGVHQWSKRFGSTGQDIGYAVAFDGSGNVVVTGQFVATVDFGGGNLTSAGGIDIFVAKYNAAGTHQWSKRFGSTGQDIGYGVAVDGSGNVLATGDFNGAVDFGGGVLNSAGGTDVFLAKYNASGTHQWSKRFGSTSSDEGFAVAVDGSDNVVVTGYFQGTVDFGGGALVSAGGDDIFLAKYNAGGAHQWSQRRGNTSNESGRHLTIAGSGNVAVTGYFQGTVDFGGGAMASAGGNDIFLANYNASGLHQWSKSFGDTGFDSGEAVAVDNMGSVVLTALFEGTVNVDGVNFVSAGGTDVLLAKYDASGAHQWSQRFGSTGTDGGDGVATDGAGNVVVTGYLEGTVNFGGGALTSAGLLDVLVAKYGSIAAEPVITSITDIGNDQGREVRISFSRSGHDHPEASLVNTEYRAYRRIDSLPAVAGEAIHGLGGTTSNVTSATDPRTVPDFDFVGAVPASGETGYHIIVSTLADSTVALGQHYSVYFIRAATNLAFSYFDSELDSGYSVDNLAPGVPASFAYNAGLLSWDESSAADFDYFSVYGGSTNAFGSATLVDYTTATDLDVNASPHVFYFVTATDFSGNEGKPAVINTLSGTGETPTQYVLSISSYPNPFNPETTVRYTVPAKGRVTIEVFDTRGARVATLINEEMDAGAYTVDWDGRNDHGNATGSGVYFARLTSPAGARGYKLTLLK